MIILEKIKNVSHVVQGKKRNAIFSHLKKGKRNQHLEMLTSLNFAISNARAEKETINTTVNSNESIYSNIIKDIILFYINIIT